MITAYSQADGQATRYLIESARPAITEAIRWTVELIVLLLVVWAVLCPLTASAQPATLSTPEPAVAASFEPNFAGQENWNDYFQPVRQELLIEEARLARLEGRFQDAEQLLEQALQINRASSGLHNPSQQTILEETLETLLLQEKWLEFDEKLDYFSWLIRRLYSADPEQLAAGLSRQARWHRAAASRNDLQSAWYLIQGKFLEWQAVSLIEGQFGRNDLRLVPFLYQIVLTHFYQTAYIERGGITGLEITTDVPVIAGVGLSSRSETVWRSYRIGRENLERIRNIYASSPEASALTDALLQLQLADWDYLFGVFDTAVESYRLAYINLTEAGISKAQLDSYFNRLQPLPLQQVQTTWPGNRVEEIVPQVITFTAWSSNFPGVQVPAEFLQPPFNTQGQDQGVVRVRFNLMVTKGDTGEPEWRITGLEMVNSTNDDQQFIEQARLQAALITFRPRLIAGELESLGPMLLDYQMAPD